MLLASVGATALLLAGASPVRAQAEQHLTVLANFQPGVFGGDEPFDALIQGRDGNFYGTGSGFLENDGGVFKVDLAGNVSGIYQFSGQDGSQPRASLVQAADGNFYGTTYQGGDSGTGTVFQLTPDGVLTTLHSFGALDASRENADGAYPASALIQATDGNFYGTAQLGGANGGGTVFQVTPDGVFTTLHTFSARDASHDNAEGSVPLAALLQASDGNFYGTASLGGAYSYGTMYEMTPDGVVTPVYSFDGYTSGAYPETALIQTADGTLYGTTSGGGSATGNSGAGVIFKIAPGETLIVLHVFGDNLDDGSNPSSLVLGSDGSLAGTTTDSPGSLTDNGTIFRLQPDGSLISLQLPGGTGPTTPFGGLVLGSDGNLYGATAYGGTGIVGTIFRFESGPAVTSAATAAAMAGQPFTYQITAQNAPVSYTAAGLPLGLSVDAATGLISGTPARAGVYNVVLAAANAAGAGHLTLTLTVAPALPVVTLATATPAVQAGGDDVGLITVSLSAAQTTNVTVN